MEKEKKEDLDNESVRKAMELAWKDHQHARTKHGKQYK